MRRDEDHEEGLTLGREIVGAQRTAPYDQKQFAQAAGLFDETGEVSTRVNYDLERTEKVLTGETILNGLNLAVA